MDWFGLGVFLGVEGYELDIIKGNNGDIKQRRRDMFSIWLRAGNNKWSDIVEALQKLHREDIAKKIANNHGQCCSNLMHINSFPVLLWGDK